MSKIVIIGNNGSGKTCYCFAMLDKMHSRDTKGFNFRINNSTLMWGGEWYWTILRDVFALADWRLPFSERLPTDNYEPYVYHLDILYALRELDAIELYEYDTSYCYHYRFKQDLLDSANCLFVCVDGSLLQGDEDELEDIADEFYSKSGMDICNALMRAEQKSGEAFPPVCILITKYDAVSPELQNMDLITKFVKLCFPMLFCKGNGKDRIVTICPVSLGKDFADGGYLCPKNVELPIYFAEYLTQRVRFRDFKDAKSVLEKLGTMLKVLPLFVNGEETLWLD